MIRRCSSYLHFKAFIVLLIIFYLFFPRNINSLSFYSSISLLSEKSKKLLLEKKNMPQRLILYLFGGFYAKGSIPRDSSKIDFYFIFLSLFAWHLQSVLYLVQRIKFFDLVLGSSLLKLIKETRIESCHIVIFGLCNQLLF